MISNFLNTRGLVLYNQLVAASPNKGWSFLTALIFLPALVIRFFKKPLPYYFKILSLIAASALSVHYLWELHTAVSLIQYLMNSSSAFFVTAPFILIATFDEERNVYRDFIFSLITLYIVGYSLSAPDCGSVGIHWGNRFVLISYPLYGLLAGYTISSLSKRIEKKHPRVILNLLFALLLTISLVLQIYSLNILQKQKRFTAELDKVIQNRPEKIIISSAWWVPHFLVSSYANKALFFVPQGNELAEFPAKLTAHGYDKFIYIAPINDNQAPPAIDSLIDTKLNFFNVKFIACEYMNQQWEVIQK